MLLLVLMKGHPGCGKSTLARALAKALKFPLVDKDDARDAMQCLISDCTYQETHPDVIGQTLNEISYEIMFATAATQLSVGLSVIVDCPLAYARLYHRAAAIAEQYGARVTVIECICSDEALWRVRLETRSALDSGSSKVHKPKSWAQIQALMYKYNGCWEWSTDGSVSLNCHVTIDSAFMSTCDAVVHIMEQLPPYTHG
ncbi:hypothetical protein CEUSTIGMA_g3976.t1 [Chlamydomonas eustigma]|uniref:Zeta toxin domain-containing protein n=1 Tax=Chlamydomonas eustigma TaxID=1157962 RepID=A0A250X1B9_9CHLO|nr:hypothetical protein CEUSTIGMA_g3976.t1 [Chlamydomonas eustigma]|eukprot:GAX76530.1 hypothetical protein CEUSTIGMA_g3976.t1 [Chlamydomonas eustigma]